MTRMCTVAVAMLGLLLVCGLGSKAVAAEETGYKVLKKYELGGDGGWDYLSCDPEGRRLYISRGNRVQVMDTETGKVVGEVPNCQGIHGIALDLKRKKGFTSNGRDSSVTIFDLETLKETGRVKVGQGPDFIIFDPASDRVFTFNAGSKDATAISAADGTVAGTIKLEGRPEAAVPDDKGQVYVNLVDKHEVLELDAKGLKVKNRWSLDPTKGPMGLAMDKVKRRLFVSCSSEKMVVLDANTGKALATLTIGKGTDAATFDPSMGLAFSSNRDGTLTIVEEKPEGQFRVAGNATTMEGAKTMALDTKSHNIFLATARYKPATGGARPTPEPNSFTIVVVGK